MSDSLADAVVITPADDDVCSEASPLLLSLFSVVEESPEGTETVESSTFSVDVVSASDDDSECIPATLTSALGVSAFDSDTVSVVSVDY